MRDADSGAGGELLSTLRQGYDLLNDSANAAWAKNEMQRRPPAALRAMYALADWDRKNPRPRPDDPPEKWTAYNQALLKFTGEIFHQYPNDQTALSRRFAAIRAPEAAAADVDEACQALIQFGNVSYNSGHVLIQAAEVYAMKGMHLDRVPRMAEEGLRSIDEPRLNGFHSDLYPALEAGQQQYSADFWRFQNWAAVANVWVLLDEKEKVRKALQQMSALLPKLAPSNQAESKDPSELMRRRQYPVFQRTYWQRTAELALRDGRKMDALTCFENALVLGAGAPASASQGGDEVISKAAALWKEFGGSDEGWQAVLTLREAMTPATSRPGVLTWTTVQKTMPAFEIPDQHGRTWTLASVRGPRNWIMDREGVVRLEQMGFLAGGNWEAQMMQAVEKAAAAR